MRSVKLPSESAGKPQGGMVYYLPKQQLKLILTVTDGVSGAAQTRTVTVVPTDAFADRGARYVAQYRRNQIGSNTLKVKVNANGLLDGDNEGSSTPQVAEFLGRLAAGVQRRSIDASPGKGCSTAGTYEWVLDATDTQRQILFENRPSPVPLTFDAIGTSNLGDPGSCGLVVTVESIGKDIKPQPQWQDGDPDSRGHGYFYRQKRPVQVTVAAAGNQQRVFVHTLVDANSPTEYLPIPRTLFAATSWKVTFSNGTPTFYDVTAGGDALGLAKLPADVLHAYSQAVIGGLNDRKSMATTETEYLKQLAALAAQQAKYEACREAAESGDKERTKAACN
ncbi:hypothetical protein GCM10023307_14950 [Lysobacter hankyongensis]|uniref:Uncharacterized protein n=1 Tax=Lysobacter hankyongensis TaxID=1176535 RepID=A0ABP9B8B4_9GAMM